MVRVQGFGPLSCESDPCCSNCLKMALAQKAFCPTMRHTAAQGVRVRVATVKVYARESRIGAKPIKVPKGVTVTVDGLTLKVKVRLSFCVRRRLSPPCTAWQQPPLPRGLLSPRCHRISLQGPKGELTGPSFPRLLSR
jgi:hypothetical protein